MVATIGELPFRERPLVELLNLVGDRVEPDADYAGFGWARARRLWLVEPGATPRAVDDALVLALHCADDAEVLANDIELYFELPDEAPVTVLASTFLERWFPRLPRDASAVVLALCNPHRASLARLAQAPLPFHFARGEVESWMALDDERIELRAPSWTSVNEVRA